MKLDFDQITVHNADKVINVIEKMIKGGDVTLDFSGVRRVDSSLLAVIFAARRAASNQGKALQLQNLPSQMDGFIQAYGVQSLF